MWRRGLFGAGFIAGMAGLAAAIAPDDPARPARRARRARAAPLPGSDDGAVVVREVRAGPRLLDLSVRSPVLDGAVAGGIARVRLLLPGGWSRSQVADGRTWPTLWLLHGSGGHADHTSWTARTSLERIAGAYGVLVVMPDGGRCGGYSDWWNRGCGGPPKWETFHLTELRQILERGYGAGTSRAIAGAGMGGTGALAYAARHRGLFHSAASFSGALNTLHRDGTGLDVPDLVELAVTIGSRGEGDQGRGGGPGRAAEWTDLWGDPDAQRLVWRQHNPHDLAGRLAGVRLYVSSGDGAPGPYDGEREGADVLEALAHRVGVEFAAKLRSLGVPAATHFYQGGHRWPYWGRELRSALPVLLAELV
jgi:S-formylglutathione hydrolase FrmB